MQQLVSMDASSIHAQFQRVYLAQADAINAVGQLQWWHVVGVIVGIVAAIYLFQARGDYARDKADAKIAEMAMENNRDLTKSYIESGNTLSAIYHELTSQREELREQHKRSQVITDAMVAAAANLVNLQKGQERQADLIQAHDLLLDENNKIMLVVSENVDALIIKSDNIKVQVEADTKQTHTLISENTNKAIEYIKGAYESISNTMIRFERLLTEVNKIHPCAELGEISTTLKIIQQRLEAQKEETNETHIPTVDLLVMPTDGKSDNGSGDTAPDAN